jgi:uncharacterized protein YbgA (DUF1722 family)/uncharacterized protein YbbK (DUF523 family)
MGALRRAIRGCETNNEPKDISASMSAASVADDVRIGISGCLLGEKVRYDGGHKKNEFLVDTLGRFVSWVPVCPEVELGLGTPRPSLRLIEVDGDLRLIESAKPSSPDSRERDRTIAMRTWAHSRVISLKRMSLSGYVLKKDSPSCGMERVRVYHNDGMPNRNGRGLFAHELIEACPNLPVEEEGRLNDSKLRENFIERVFAYHALNRFFEGHWGLHALIAFHSAHKLQLLAHSTEGYNRLGRLVASGKGTDRTDLARSYQDEFMATLRVHATRGRHANVLQHMAGYFKKRLDPRSRAELQELITDYRSGLVPLIAPITLVRQYVSAFEVAYLKDQVYLMPHPKELMLRNHV